jgi:hypothetical protein
MPSRRRILTVTATAVISAGCVSTPENQSGSSPGDANDDGQAPDGAVSGTAEPISVAKTVTDPDIEYVSSNQTVRYPFRRSGADYTYKYLAFSKWAYVEGASVAADAVTDRLDERLSDTENVTAGIYDSDGEDLIVLVKLVTTLDDSGDVVSKPDVGVDRVVSATPERIEATVELSSETHTDTYVAYVIETESRPV